MQIFFGIFYLQKNTICRTSYRTKYRIVKQMHLARAASQIGSCHLVEGDLCNDASVNGEALRICVQEKFVQ